MNQWIENFRQTINSASQRLLQISEAKSEPPRPDGLWSAKQIMGRLLLNI